MRRLKTWVAHTLAALCVAAMAVITVGAVAFACLVWGFDTNEHIYKSVAVLLAALYLDVWLVIAVNRIGNFRDLPPLHAFYRMDPDWHFLLLLLGVGLWPLGLVCAICFFVWLALTLFYDAVLAAPLAALTQGIMRFATTSSAR